MRKIQPPGFTIIEILISVAIGSGITLVAFYLMFFFTSNFNAIQGKIDTERNLIQSIYNIQRVLSMAIELDPATGTIGSPTISPPAGRGLIRTNFDESKTAGGAFGTVETMALFLRERGGFQNPPQGAYAPTAIFYLRPTETRSGVLFLDVSMNAVKAPDYSDVFFDHVVGLSFTNPVFSPANPGDPARLTSLEVSVTMRNFLETPTAQRRWTFCPELDLGGCTANTYGSFKDLNRKIRITFSNQILMQNDPRRPNIPDTPYERTFGQLYLFPLVF